MSLRTCFHCGSPVFDCTEKRPQCQADLATGVETAASGITSSSDWQNTYEVPWFDLPLAIRIIRDPAEVSLSDAESTIRKFAGRSRVVSAIALVISFFMFFVALLPAVLGVTWAIMVVRLARQAHTRTRRAQATVGFALGLLACANVIMTLLINVG